MDIEQAKLILRVHRLLAEGYAGNDACPDVEELKCMDLGNGRKVNLSPESVDAALNMTNENPELAAWYEQELAIDEAMSDMLTAIDPPDDLRDRILVAAAPRVADGNSAVDGDQKVNARSTQLP